MPGTVTDNVQGDEQSLYSTAGILQLPLHASELLDRPQVVVGCTLCAVE
jgi:hypothetical protein